MFLLHGVTFMGVFDDFSFREKLSWYHLSQRQATSRVAGHPRSHATQETRWAEGDHRARRSARNSAIEVSHSGAADHSAGLRFPLARTDRQREVCVDLGPGESSGSGPELRQSDHAVGAADVRLVEAIVDGREPSGLSLERLVKRTPVVWEEQREKFGFHE